MNKNIKTISIDELDKLGIDENNKLYWDGKPLLTEEKIILQKYVNASIIIGAFSTAVIAFIETLKYLCS